MCIDIYVHIHICIAGVYYGYHFSELMSLIGTFAHLLGRPDNSTHSHLFKGLNGTVPYWDILKIEPIDICLKGLNGTVPISTILLS